MSKYSVLVVGMGKRGMHHATAFNANPKFQVTGICDIDAKRRATHYLHERPLLVEEAKG